MTTLDLRCPACHAGQHPHIDHPCDCPCCDVVPF